MGLINRMTVDMIRKNTVDFVSQNNEDSCILMPVLPKRILLLCDTIDALYDEKEKADGH